MYILTLARFVPSESLFRAPQTRFSLFAICISADKSYLTYPYPTPRGIDKKRITTRVINTLVV